MQNNITGTTTITRITTMASITTLERVLQIHLRRRNGPSGHVARVMALRTIWQIRAARKAAQ